MHSMRKKAFGGLVLGAALAAGCGGGAGTGDARILVEAEESIVLGLEPGTDDESITDGWAIEFDAYVVAIGEVELRRSADPGASARSDAVVLVDLVTLDTAHTLDVIGGLAPGRWDRFAFATPAATASTPCDPSVADSDCERMRAEGLTYLIRGKMTKPGGESCPPDGACRDASAIDFELAVAAPTLYVGCETDGLGGVAIPEGGETSASLTIHGDHLFFNGFPGGTELVVRRAQWLANADVDGDGRVDMAELASIGSGDFPALFTGGTDLVFGEAYTLTGSPITPLATAADYVRAQLSTQGHLNGEGECAFDAL